MLWLSRKDIEHISRRLLRDYLKKVPQKVDHIDPADFAEKMCGLQFTFADISEAHDAIGLTATPGVIITIPQRDGTRLDYELDGKTAFIDQSLVAENQIGRLNFTMMHEAAHQVFWMLYPEEYEAQTPRCVFRMADEHTQYSVLDWEEWQTNVLTSFLLLPKELVYRHMANVGLKDGISVLNRIYARKDYERFSEAAKRLGVFKTALAIRSSQLGLLMEKEELLSLAVVVALLVAGGSDASDEDGLSKLVSDGVVVPVEESETVYPGDTAGDSTVPLSEIHPAMIIQVTRANEAAIEPMAIFFCRAFFFCSASAAVLRVDNCFSYSSKRSELRAESFFFWRSFSISFSKSAMLFGFLEKRLI